MKRPTFSESSHSPPKPPILLTSSTGKFARKSMLPARPGNPPPLLRSVTSPFCLQSLTSSGVPRPCPENNLLPISPPSLSQRRRPKVRETGLSFPTTTREKAQELRQTRACLGEAGCLYPSYPYHIHAHISINSFVYIDLYASTYSDIMNMNINKRFMRKSSDTMRDRANVYRV